MAISNHERVGKALEALNNGLRPFVERELKSAYPENWFDEARQSLGAAQAQLGTNKNEIAWDAASLLLVMWNLWNDVFKKMLGHLHKRGWG